jgi:penicillin-binding protein 2
MYRSFSLLSLVCAAIVITLSLFSTNADAQKSKSAAGKKPAAKTGDKKKDAKSDSKSAKNKSSKKDDDKRAAKKDDSKNARDKKNDRAAADKKSDKKSKNKKDEQLARGNKDKKSADKRRDDKEEKNDKKADKKADKRRDAESLAKRREAERREAEERREAARREAERRAAIEAERRRREQARREAIARARAFEKGLRDETVANILADDVTGEDLDVRRAAIEALGKRAGTVVVMDAQNGRVVSMVNQKWAVERGFKPCSTIKLVTGVAGINEKIINEAGGNGHRAPMDLTDALAYSNNKYFQQVGGDVGYPKMMNYARELGLGAPTGINVPNESAGKIPDTKSGFALNRMSSHGDDFEVTPVQLATMVSAITNGGKLLKPQVVRKQEKVGFAPTMRRQLVLPQTALRGVQPGMMGAVGYGTARRAQDASLNIAGKTGSCIGQGSWLGLFASVAPVVNPKYAVVVVTRGQAERGKFAAQVAGKVYQALASRIRANNPPQTMIVAGSAPAPVAPPRPKIDPKTAARLSVEESDVEDEEATADAEDLTGGDFVNGKSNGKSGKFEERLPANGRVVVTSNLPTNESANKVRNTTKVYPRGNQNSTATPQTAPTNEQRRPRVVLNPKP